jgi:hypothetical protein
MRFAVTVPYELLRCNFLPVLLGVERQFPIHHNDLISIEPSA